MINVTIFNEFKHENESEAVAKIHPRGIHETIKDFLVCDDINVRTLTQYDTKLNLIPHCGFTDEIIENTDVLIWWGHGSHALVPDELVQKLHQQIQCGMGAVFLHSAHHSKLFKSLMGTTCNLSWRDGAKERLWNICPAHPIMAGIGDYVDLSSEEMYGECFQIPKPDELLMIGTYASHEVFRSACTWQRANGRIFYFQPGHESNPSYHNSQIQKIIKNAVYWVAPTYREKESVCPETKEIPFE